MFLSLGDWQDLMDIFKLACYVRLMEFSKITIDSRSYILLINFMTWNDQLSKKSFETASFSARNLL
jgi:hypothetical protein